MTNYPFKPLCLGLNFTILIITISNYVTTITVCTYVCIIAPSDPNPNDANFGVGGDITEDDPNEADPVVLAIVFLLGFGIPLLFLVIVFCIVFCIACEVCKLIKSCFKGCFECCLSVQRLFDIRRYFRNENNGYVMVCNCYNAVLCR